MTCHAQLRAIEDLGPADADLFRLQQKVEDLYEAGQYERAYAIYLKELVPIGDKYAQYMVGYMHHAGKSVPKDKIEASAWYRLAAERRNSDFESVRDELLADFKEPELLRSDELFIDLRRRYSDVVLLLRQIRSDLEFARATFSADLRMSGEVSMTVIPEAGLLGSTDQMKRRVRNRIESRLRLLDSYLDGVAVETDVDRMDMAELETQVDTFLGEIKDR